MQPTNFIDESAHIGEGTVAWHYCTILADVEIGKNCSIGSGTEIGRGSVIGKDTRISAHVFLPSNSQIGERVFIGPGCVFTDDRYPRAGNHYYNADPPIIHSGASIGAGSVILPGVTIGVGALVAAGSIVTKDVAPHDHVRGEPARVKPLSIMPSTRQELYVGPRVEKGDEHIA